MKIMIRFDELTEHLISKSIFNVKLQGLAQKEKCYSVCHNLLSYYRQKILKVACMVEIK